MTDHDASPKSMRYEDAYVWLIFISAMDIMLTWMVMFRGGYEANSLAAAVVQHFGLPGMVAFKMAIIIFVIVLCEFIGKRQDRAGRFLAHAAIGLSCLPVVIGFWLLISRR